jgi:hypothetical protein
MAYKFIQPNEYLGKQLILNSDRVLFHGRKDTILVANEAFVVTADELHSNANILAKINSPKVYIGPVENQQDPNNPAVKGEELVDTLGQIIDKFIQFLTVQYPLTSTTPTVGTPSPSNLTNVQTLVAELNTLKTSLDRVKSDKVYIK